MPKTPSRSVKVFYPRSSRQEIIRALQGGVAHLAARVPLVKAVLFGSYASGRHTVASDVDVLIVYSGESRDDVYALAKQLIRVPGLEPHVYSASEAEQVRDLLSRMTRDGICVYPLPDPSECGRRR